MLLARLLRRRAEAPVGLPGPPAETAPPPASPSPAQPEPLSEVLRQVEEDVILTMRVVGHAAEDVRDKIDRTTEIMESMREASHELSSLTGAAFEVASGLADTTRHLEQTGEVIEGHVAGSDEFIADAQSLAGTVTADMTQLSAAVERIAGVVAIISAIARQTNLLALNASIEAARAGAAGRGFAVVATEVKALAGQVQAATNEISAHIVGLQAVARGSGETVTDIADLLERVGPVMSSVRDGVRTQIEGAREVASRAGESLEFVSIVSRKAEAMTRMTAEAADATRRVSDTAERMVPTVRRLSERSTAFLQHAEGRDRRQGARFPVRLPARFLPPAGSNRPAAELQTLDLSLGGGLVEPAQVGLHEGDAGTLVIEGIGTVEAVVRSVMDDGIHLAFPRVPPDSMVVLQARLAEAERQNQPLIRLAQAAAADIGAAFAEALSTGAVEDDDLVTTDYRPIPGTDPLQYETKGLAFYERVLPPVLARHREQCPQRLFLVACDRNSYIPVHEPSMSQPPRAGDSIWNERHARNRRLFDRSKVMIAARNHAPFQLSAFMRLMPDGQWRAAKLIASPVMVRGRLWGNVLLGLPL